MRSMTITYDTKGYYKLDVVPGPPAQNDRSKVTFVKEDGAPWQYVEITGPGGTVEHHELFGESGGEVSYRYELGAELSILYSGLKTTFTFNVGPRPAVPPQLGTVTVP